MIWHNLVDILQSERTGMEMDRAPAVVSLTASQRQRAPIEGPEAAAFQPQLHKPRRRKIPR